jgi:hypothetical protein
VDAVSFGEINRIEILEDKLKLIWQSYQENKWQWCLRLIKKRCALSRENLTPGYLAGLIRDWRTEAVKLNNMILKDAMREFDEISKIGYGIDGSMDEDFLAVRGSCEENSFIGQLKEENAQIEERALKALSILESHIESVHA